MPHPGQIFNQHYQLQAQLGQGRSRQTWLAQDISITPAEPVVIKLLTVSPQIQWDELKLFEREAQVLKSLHHPCIPRYRDYFGLDALPDSRFPWFALVQTYIPGTSFQQLLDQGRHFTPVEIEKIAVGTLHILSYLHDQSPLMLHRDIKPGNLIWGDDNRIYLVDFGAVQDQAAREGAAFTFVGTYGYAPIEQFGGRAAPASDLYALGATLIHLLTGISPADLPHEDARIRFADQISADPGLINWLGKLTEPHPSEWFSTAQQALAAWKNRQSLSAPILHPRPTGSQIQLEKSASRLAIHIPARHRNASRNLYLEVFLAKLRIIMGASGLLLGPLGAFAFPLALIYAGISLLWPIFGQTDLHCDRRYIRAQQKLLGLWCRLPQRISTAAIAAVYEEASIEGSNYKQVVLATKSGQKIHTNPLAAVERIWLIQEIREWLGLEPVSQQVATDDWETRPSLSDDWNA